MNQKTFDTRQRAEELLNEAIAVWKQGNYSDQMEGMKDDPVFQLLISAIAYQANEIDGDIERIKQDVLEEFSSILTPYDAGHATPATAVIRTMPSQGIGYVDINSESVFKLEGTEYRFTPLLCTRVLSWKVGGVTRLDGRKWEVRMVFDSPVSDLSMATFAIRNPGFKDLSVTVGGRELPLIRPWEYSELPFSDNFSLENIAFNKSTIYDPSMSVVDLFAKHDLRIYCIGMLDRPGDFIREEALEISMVFEFEGIRPDFRFSSSDIVLNPVLLANVDVYEATVDSENPIVRINDVPDKAGSRSPQLVHVMTPNNDQLYSDAGIVVRKVSADRFNQGALVHLLSSLLGKYHTDFYAFSKLSKSGGDEIVRELGVLLNKLLNIASDSSADDIRGTYIMLGNYKKTENISLKVKYLTTYGSAASEHLDIGSRFIVPGGVDAAETEQIANPEPGTDEVKGVVNDDVRYHIQTGNRIITVSDIRMFCCKELNGRYGITSSSIRGISVSPHINEDHISRGNACGYEISVLITITGSPFVQRSFCHKIPQAEILLEKMMQVRSTNIYPINVTIEIV